MVSEIVRSLATHFKFASTALYFCLKFSGNHKQSSRSSVPLFNQRCYPISHIEEVSNAREESFQSWLLSPDLCNSPVHPHVTLGNTAVTMRQNDAMRII